MLLSTLCLSFYGENSTDSRFYFSCEGDDDSMGETLGIQVTRATTSLLSHQGPLFRDKWASKIDIFKLLMNI